MKITVVAGPPGSGKTTYARERMRRGDLIVDMDALYQALSGLELRDKPDELLPFVAEARDAVISRLYGWDGENGQAFVISAKPDLVELQELAIDLRGQLVVLDVPADECARRMKKEGRKVLEPMIAFAREWHTRQA